MLVLHRCFVTAVVCLSLLYVSSANALVGGYLSTPRVNLNGEIEIPLQIPSSFNTPAPANPTSNMEYVLLYESVDGAVANISASFSRNLNLSNTTLSIPARARGKKYSYYVVLGVGTTYTGQFNGGHTTETYTSNTVEITYQYLAPAAPSYVMPSPISLSCDTNFNLTWTSVDKAIYRVDERTRIYGVAEWGQWAPLAERQVGAALLLPPNKSNGVEYQYRVQSFYAGNGADSDLSPFVESAPYYKPKCPVASGTVVGDSGATNPLTPIERVSLDGSAVANDILVAAPNTQGISYNKVNSFDISAKTRIFNGVKSTPAKLIIIETTGIDLTSQLELIGNTADLLLISRSELDTINCQSCSFLNFGRVTLATAKPNLTLKADNTTVGELNINRNAQIIINNLSAPGINSLEILAGKLTLNGSITTNQRANRRADGGFDKTPTGSLTLGGGGINLFISGLRVDYEKLSTTHADPKNAQVLTEVEPITLNGSIESASINISAFEPITFRSIVNTKADAIVYTNYRNEVAIPSGNITIQTFGNNSPLFIESGITADSKLSLRSGNNLVISNQINADEIEVLANNRVSNTRWGNLQAKKIDIAATSIENLGYINSANVNLAALGNIYNQYGGQLLGTNITLESRSGVIRNGALTPYIISGSSGGEGVINSAGLNQYQDYVMGTYYRIASQPAGTKIKADSQIAKILGNNISIKGRSLENINPYFQLSDPAVTNLLNGNEFFTFSSKRLSQVSLLAAQALRIETTDSIVNTSAVMGVTQPMGIFEVTTGLLTNERYLASFAINNTSTSTTSSTGTAWGPCKTGGSSSTCGDDNATFTTALSDIFDTALAIAPPGDIYSMGSFKLKATTGMVNRYSFFEVDGNADFNSPIVKNIGVERTANHTKKVTVSSEKFWTTGDYSNSTTVETIGTRETLFYVRGNTYATTSNLVIENATPYQDIKTSSLNNWNTFVATLRQTIIDLWNAFKDFF